MGNKFAGQWAKRAPTYAELGILQPPDPRILEQMGSRTRPGKVVVCCVCHKGGGRGTLVKIGDNTYKHTNC